nr:ORF2 [Tick-associated anellovirus 8]
MYRRLPEPGTLEYKRAEAHWKKNASYTHNFFCACGDFLSHFRWPGSLGGIGSGSGMATTGVVRGPLDGASITGHGSGDEVRDAIHAAVAFDLDDTG